jgi:hypothetical protein
MPGFVRGDTSGVVLWGGDPDCQAAHDAILHWLNENCPNFYTDASEDDNILKGNLGETIVFCVGHWYVFNADFRRAKSAHIAHYEPQRLRGIGLLFVRRFSA